MRLQLVVTGADFQFQRHAAGQQQGGSHQLADFGRHVLHFLAHGLLLGLLLLDRVLPLVSGV
jgi:hypothetical protein